MTGKCKLKPSKKTLITVGIGISLFVCVTLIRTKTEEPPSTPLKVGLHLQPHFSTENYYPRGTLRAPAVVLKPKGGLGNQLFQYACSYALARKYGWPLYTLVPTHIFQNASQRKFGVKDRPFILDKFNIPLNEWNTIKKPDWSRLSSTLDPPIMLLDDSQLLLSPTFSPDRVIQLSDAHYCKSEAYFTDFKEEILELFQFQVDPSPVVRHWTKVIENDVGGGESVAVHVRRGDFIPWGRAVPLSYHKNAMKSMGKMLKGFPITFYVFSDDIPYVKTELGSWQTEFTKEDFPNGMEVVFVSDPERITSLQDFYLITRCKHGIIPNSSYSWWAAYLIRNPGKRVIAAYTNITDVTQFHQFLFFYFSYPKSWFTVDPFGRLGLSNFEESKLFNSECPDIRRLNQRSIAPPKVEIDVMSALWEFPPTSAPVETNPAILYRVHVPKLTQLFTGKNFHYFKLYLHDIGRFFTEKKGWNRDYPPGQQIYSDACPTSPALRAAISTEHSIVYSGRGSRAGNEDGAMGRSPTAFFDLLYKFQDNASAMSPIHDTFKAGYDWMTSKAAVPEDPVPIYTYVLMDKNLRFSRSGAGTSVDMSSKHALHAGAQPEVCYAGEFWIEPPVRGQDRVPEVLYMDNNSGTFAPPKKDLGRMKWLMEANFPGIQIVVLDYQDQEWKIRRKKV